MSTQGLSGSQEQHRQQQIPASSSSSKFHQLFTSPNGHSSTSDIWNSNKNNNNGNNNDDDNIDVAPTHSFFNNNNLDPVSLPNKSYSTILQSTTPSNNTTSTTNPRNLLNRHSYSFKNQPFNSISAPPSAQRHSISSLLVSNNNNNNNNNVNSNDPSTSPNSSWLYSNYSNNSIDDISLNTTTLKPTSRSSRFFPSPKVDTKIQNFDYNNSTARSPVNKNTTTNIFNSSPLTTDSRRLPNSYNFSFNESPSLKHYDGNQFDNSNDNIHPHINRNGSYSTIFVDNSITNNNTNPSDSFSSNVMGSTNFQNFQSSPLHNSTFAYNNGNINTPITINNNEIVNLRAFLNQNNEEGQQVQDDTIDIDTNNFFPSFVNDLNNEIQNTFNNDIGIINSNSNHNNNDSNNNNIIHQSSPSPSPSSSPTTKKSNAFISNNTPFNNIPNLQPKVPLLNLNNLKQLQTPIIESPHTPLNQQNVNQLLYNSFNEEETTSKEDKEIHEDDNELDSIPSPSIPNIEMLPICKPTKGETLGNEIDTRSRILHYINHVIIRHKIIFKSFIVSVPNNVKFSATKKIINSLFYSIGLIKSIYSINSNGDDNNSQFIKYKIVLIVAHSQLTNNSNSTIMSTNMTSNTRQPSIPTSSIGPWKSVKVHNAINKEFREPKDSKILIFYDSEDFNPENLINKKTDKLVFESKQFKIFKNSIISNSKNSMSEILTTNNKLDVCWYPEGFSSTFHRRGVNNFMFVRELQSKMIINRSRTNNGGSIVEMGEFRISMPIEEMGLIIGNDFNNNSNNTNEKIKRSFLVHIDLRELDGKLTNNDDTNSNFNRTPVNMKRETINNDELRGYHHNRSGYKNHSYHNNHSHNNNANNDNETENSGGYLTNGYSPNSRGRYKKRGGFTRRGKGRGGM